MVTPSPDDRAARVSATEQRSGPLPAAGAGSRSWDLYRAHRQARQELWLATRRRALRWVIRAGTGAFSLALLLPALALRSLTRGVQEIAAGDTLVYASGDRSGLPVDIAALEPGTAVHAFPEGKAENERNLVELVRLAADLPTGLVAYSAICTHLGCTVLPNLTEQGDILCPCHASVFDPADGARVLAGPAPRPLPSLPVETSPDGRVVAAAGFAGPVGPM